MSTVYATIIDQLNDQHALFNVREEDVLSASGIAIPNRKVLINESSNAPMGVVSTKYKTVTNHEIFESFATSIEKSGINAEGVKAAVNFSNGGGKTMVKFTFPNEVIKVDGDRSETQLQIVAVNSFNGSTRYMTKVGGFRITCLNGSILGTTVGSYSSAHTPSLDVGSGAEKIIAMMQSFQTAKEYWGAMMKTKITDSEAMQVIAEFFGLSDDEIVNESKRASVQKMVSLYDGYALEMGRNAYALYNCLTDFISHKTYKNETAATAMLFNQDRVTKILDTNAVFQLS